PSLWIAVFSALAVAGFVVGDISRRTSPGDLTQVHKREPDLTGRWHCSNCHGGWRQSMTEACLVCHKTIGDQIAAGGGLHGHLDGQLRDQCSVCHSEHHGAGFVIVNDKSFANAGTPDLQKYDHAAIGYRMGGKHLEIACDKCHPHANDVELSKDAQ